MIKDKLLEATFNHVGDTIKASNTKATLKKL